MGEPVVGDVVVISFPFSDRSATKRRPAFVAAVAEHGDLILCQSTSKRYSSEIALPLGKEDFQKGGLPQESFVRPDKLFTASRSIVKLVAGTVRQPQRGRILETVAALFRP